GRDARDTARAEALPDGRAAGVPRTLLPSRALQHARRGGDLCADGGPAPLDVRGNRVVADPPDAAAPPVQALLPREDLRSAPQAVEALQARVGLLGDRQAGLRGDDRQELLGGGATSSRRWRPCSSRRSVR